MKAKFVENPHFFTLNIYFLYFLQNQPLFFTSYPTPPLHSTKHSVLNDILIIRIICEFSSQLVCSLFKQFLPFSHIFSHQLSILHGLDITHIFEYHDCSLYHFIMMMREFLRVCQKVFCFIHIFSQAENVQPQIITQVET